MQLIKLFIFTIFPVFVLAQDAEIVVDAVHLRDSVYMLRANTPFGNSTSVVSIGNEGSFLADTSFGMATAAIEEKVQALGGKPIAFATATHFHGDHTEGFEVLDPSVVIITPTKQRIRLATGEVVGGDRPLMSSALPEITFNSGLSLHINNEEIQLSTPSIINSHTDTDAFIYFVNANVLYIGDHLFLNRYPIIDLENGGDIEGYFSNIKKIIDTKDSATLIVPGHGTFDPDPPRAITMAELTAQYELLMESIDIVVGAIENGKTLAEIIDQGLPSHFDIYNERPRYVSEESWLTMLFNYYQAN